MGVANTVDVQAVARQRRPRLSRPPMASPHALTQGHTATHCPSTSGVGACCSYVSF